MEAIIKMDKSDVGSRAPAAPPTRSSGLTNLERLLIGRLDDDEVFITIFY
jgi:hypothetical protein